MQNILIGGAWPYANNSLHVGHLAALLPADIIARYYRAKGANVIYVSGTDSHGTPITIRAKKEGVSPRDTVNKYHEEFVESFNELDFSYDLYSITMCEFHSLKVQEYFKIIMNNGYIYEKLEEQDFCLNCDNFLSDREILGTCPHCKGVSTGEQCDVCLTQISPKDLLDKKCKVCNKETVVKKNKHLYFKLSAFQEPLSNFINNQKWRKNAINESSKFLNLGLIDRAATRQLDWGVDVPVEGYEDKKIYVWIEAVLGYLTALESVCKERNIDINEFLLDTDNLKTYFVHGKDNITFHTIIYPALLLAISPKYKLPTHIISSEYVNTNDEKMSKSKGNLLTIDELASMYDKDTIRYYMIANGPEKKDINFTSTDLINTHNKFLVGVIGNFVNRNLSFINKKFDGIIKEGEIDNNISNLTKETYIKVGNLIEEGELRSAIEEVVNYASLANKYYDESAPWILVKEDINKFYNITYTCVYIMANLSNLLNPFIPSSANKIKKMLSLDIFKWEETKLAGDIKINDLELLFNRIED